jgi:hypothetical protein
LVASPLLVIRPVPSENVGSLRTYLSADLGAARFKAAHLIVEFLGLGAHFFHGCIVFGGLHIIHPHHGIRRERRAFLLRASLVV